MGLPLILGLLAGGAAASGVSNAFNRNAAIQDRKWQEQQAQKQMDFQERMSNTSWQRGVADMQAAGLNPALAYMQGGASSASGASPHGDGGMLNAMMRSQQMMYNLANTAILVGGINSRNSANIMHSEWKHTTRRA